VRAIANGDVEKFGEHHARVEVAKSSVISVVCVRSRLPAREHRHRQIEHDPHRRNYRQVLRGRLRMTL